MKTAAFALWLAAVAPTGPTDLPEPVRPFVAAVRVGEAETIRLEFATPHVEAAEWARIRADERLRETLVERHLGRIGLLRVDREFRLGTALFGAGDYRISLDLGADPSMALVLDGGAAPKRVALATRRTDNHVAQVTFAFLARGAGDELDLEVRFADVVATALLSISRDRLIEDLNNLAFELLTAPDAEARNPAKALILARRANHLAGGGHPLILDTLALALFETGDVARAIETQRVALAALPAEHAARRELETRLTRFEGARGP